MLRLWRAEVKHENCHLTVHALLFLATVWLVAYIDVQVLSFMVHSIFCRTTTEPPSLAYILLAIQSAKCNSSGELLCTDNLPFPL